MKIAVTGVQNGKAGNIAGVLIDRGAIPLDCDVTDENSVREALKGASPDIVIHTASKSSPDWCEENTDEAISVNFGGARNVATITEEMHIPMVALSTDHIFTGKLALTKVGPVFSGPYGESEKRIYPVNYYGMTKFAMEAAMDTFEHVKIVRTSNCFWANDPRAVWYIDQLYKSDKVPVPVFQHRSFMHIIHFAEALEAYCEKFEKMPKTLHLSGSETVSWYEFIKDFADALEIPKVLSKKFTKKRFDEKHFAERPKKAGLKVDLSVKLGIPQFSYKDGLELMK